jgi:hypothetical protein
MTTCDSRSGFCASGSDDLMNDDGQPGSGLQSNGTYDQYTNMIVVHKKAVSGLLWIFYPPSTQGDSRRRTPTGVDHKCIHFPAQHRAGVRTALSNRRLVVKLIT